jgi:hypothetical protein
VGCVAEPGDEVGYRTIPSGSVRDCRPSMPARWPDTR